MYLLGVHFSDASPWTDERLDFPEHDTAAAVLEDQEIIAAVEQERIDRVKHSCFFPGSAISRCLKLAGIDWDQLDRICLPFMEQTLKTDAERRFQGDPWASYPTSAAAWIADVFARELDVDVGTRLRFCAHHTAHAWSAFGPSGFERALVITLDGAGDYESGAAFLADGTSMKKLREYPRSSSLGHFYLHGMRHIGFRWFEEYKVMGLAPYGDWKRYESAFQHCFRLLPDGDYELVPQADLRQILLASGVPPRVRRPGEALTQEHYDYAAGLQHVIESVALHVVRHFREATGARALCLAGGVAHNSSMNGVLLRSGLFERMYVQPAAHDAGLAIGAALGVYHAEAAWRKSPARAQRKQDHTFLGADLPNRDALIEVLAPWLDVLTVEHSDAIEWDTAGLLADGAVVGWLQGRAEFGPRALGHRSIITDARPVDNRDRINLAIKGRESFRPFAPAVLEGHAAKYFDLGSTEADLSFMTYVVPVRPDARKLLGAVTHIDGSARIQVVSARQAPRFAALLEAYAERTGVAVLLNTSFNNNHEPIVDSLEDAIACLLTTNLDIIVAGDLIIRKRPRAGENGTDLRRASLVLAPGRKLVCCPNAAGRQAWAIEPRTPPTYGIAPLCLSPEVGMVLCRCDGSTPLSQLLDSIPDPDRAGVLVDLRKLWSQRHIVVRRGPGVHRHF